MANSIEAVFMVEASRQLRESQKNVLCGPDSPSIESNVGHHSTGKHGGVPIVWAETMKSIPIGRFLIVVWRGLPQEQVQVDGIDLNHA